MNCMTVRTVIGNRDGRMRSDLFPFKAISVMHKEKKTVLCLKPWQTERTVFFCFGGHIRSARPVHDRKTL